MSLWMEKAIKVVKPASSSAATATWAVRRIASRRPAASPGFPVNVTMRPRRILDRRAAPHDRRQRPPCPSARAQRRRSDQKMRPYLEGVFVNRVAAGFRMRKDKWHGSRTRVLTQAAAVRPPLAKQIAEQPHRPLRRPLLRLHERPRRRAHPRPLLRVAEQPFAPPLQLRRRPAPAGRPMFDQATRPAP